MWLHAGNAPIVVTESRRATPGDMPVAEGPALTQLPLTVSSTHLALVL